MDIVYKKWTDISIKLFYEINDILIDKTTSDIEKKISLIALLSNTDESQVRDMSLTDFNKCLTDIEWLNSPNFNRDTNIKTLEIDGKKYNIVRKLKNITIAQYIDFQTFWQKKDLKHYTGNLLACFILPSTSKKYAEDYDPLELADLLNNNLDIVTAQSLLFFFLKQYLTLMVSSFTYLRKKVKTKEEREVLTNTLQGILHGLQLSTLSQI